jgi:hypothetical protein
MGAMHKIFLVSGLLMLLGGLGLMAVAFTTDDTEMMFGFIGGGAGVAVTGLVFLVVTRFLKGFLGAAALDDPVPGTAHVLSVTDTGTTINVSAVFKIRATITVPERAPYEGEFRLIVGRAQMGAIQPGMTLPVLVERTDPAKIVHDPSRAATISPLAGAMGGGVSAVTRTSSAADVIARGVPTQGVLHVAEVTGLTAGQVVGTLPAHEADDPLVKVVFAYTPNGMAEQVNEILVRVPDGKGHWLQPGETLPIAYLPDDPTTATIDWSRL